MVPSRVLLLRGEAAHWMAVMTGAVAKIYYSGCFTAMQRSASVHLISKSISSSLVRGRTEKYDLWISATGSHHCSCPFVRFQTLETKEPCKHVLSLALTYLLHKGFFNAIEPTQ